MALTEIGVDSGLRQIRSLGDNHFYESTSPLSNHKSLEQELHYQLVKTYISPHFRTERRLRICPDKAIARRLSPQLAWLPDEHNLSIWWAIQIHPTHWSNLSNDPWSLDQVLNCNVEVHLG